MDQLFSNQEIHTLSDAFPGAVPGSPRPSGGKIYILNGSRSLGIEVVLFTLVIDISAITLFII